MPAKFIQCTNLQLVIILTVALLLSCHGALSTDIQMDDTDSPNVLQPGTNVKLNNTQETRYSRVRMLSTTNEADNPDERGLNFGSTVTKLNGLSTSGIQKLEKFVENTKLKMSSKQKATDKLFMKFEVGKVEANLFESPQFQNWFTSVNNLYKKNVEKGEMTMLTTLTTKYGDDALPKLLTEAKRSSRTNVIARKLEEAQLTKWLAEKIDVGSVFNLLKLDEAGDDLFKSPLLSTWARYAFKLEKQPEETMFLALRTHFDEDVLAKMLIAAKEESSIASKLEKVELDQWLRSGKTSDEAFKLLGLNDDTGNLLKNPTINTWASYVTKVEKKSPYDAVYAKLATRYDDENMITLISSAKQNSKTKRLAINLEMAQLKAWAKGDKSPSDVFKLLSLQVEEGIDLLKSDKLRVWVAYVEQLKKNPDELLLNELKLHYNDETLASMLAMSKIDYRSKQTGERLESFLQNNWIGEDKTAQDVFKLMKLEREGESIFTSPMWSSWNAYVTRLSKGDPDESMYLILKSQFGEEKLTRMIDAAKDNRRTKNIADKLQEEIRRSEGKSADDIFKLLKLDEKKEKFFESPVLSTWISYVTKLEKLKVEPNEFVIVAHLEKKFGKVKLAHILAMEKKQKHVATTKKVITDLQGMQFKQWMTEKGMDPKRVELMLLQDTSKKISPASVQVTYDFYDFYKANGGSPFYMYT